MILLDTGPLVALIRKQDRDHPWMQSQWSNITPPVLTCEPVLTEAFYLLRNDFGGSAGIFQLIRLGVLVIPFSLVPEQQQLENLMARYANVPMSLADACLVRMSELYTDCSVMTLDSDFTIYRKNRNQPIPVLMP